MESSASKPHPSIPRSSVNIDTTVIDSSNDTALAGAYSSQNSPNKHFFGYHLIKSPTKSAQAASRLQSESRHELDAVKRHLNFSTKQYVSDQVGPQRCPSITPDEDLVRSFNSLSDRLTQALDPSISMFSVVFYSSPACDCGRIPMHFLAKPPSCPHWKVGVVVLEQEFETAEKIVYEISKKPSRLPIKTLIGQYSFVGTPNRYHYDKPGPGASLAHEDDEYSSATLGGYVRGTRTGRIMALTVGHMIFNKPLDPTTPISPMTSIGSGHRISSPSSQDHYDSLAELNSRIRNLNPIDDKDLYKRLSNTLVDVCQKGYGRYFGESSYAIWQLDNAKVGPHPGIHDMALIRPAEQRLGKNLITLPPGKYVSNLIRGSAHPVDAAPVYKVGRSTGFTEGYIVPGISSTHKHVDFKCFISVRCVRAVDGVMLAPGDSGSLLLNDRGYVVGMINGGLTAVDRRSREVEMSEGSFIPAGQIVDWASEVMFEPVEFVKAELE